MMAISKHFKFPGGASSVLGFTLIELLTVIAVIGLLAAILIPSLGAVRVRADQTTCASNMRQIGAAVQLYANEHSGRLPGIAGHGDNESSWVLVLRKYLDEVDEIRISPADPRGDEKRRAENATTYVANNLVFAPERDRFGRLVGGARSMFELEDPAQTRIFFIGAEHRGANVTNDHTHAEGWDSWSAVASDISPDLHRRGKASPNRTNGSSNYLFADGRVEQIDASDFKAMVDRGINPAKPRSVQN